MHTHESQAPGFQPQASASKSSPLGPRPFEVTFPGQELVTAPTNPFVQRSANSWAMPPPTPPVLPAPPPEGDTDRSEVELDWRPQFSLYAQGEPTPPPPRPWNLQAKLTIGQPNDPYEQEADQVAEQVSTPTAGGVSISDPSDSFEQEAEQIAQQVMRMPAHRVITQTATSAVQRQPAPPSELRAQIAKALQSQQYLDVAEIADLTKATDEEKVTLSRICISGGYIAPQDATNKVFTLWSSMGDQLSAIASSHLSDWESASRFCPRLMTLQSVTQAQADFQSALRNLAESNLKANEAFIEERKKKLGLQEGEEPLTPQQETELRQGIQSMAWHAWELRQEQAKHREMVVGYAEEDLGFGQHKAKFNPAGPPKVQKTLFSTPPHKWEDVKSAWDDAEDEIANIGNEYPELYEASQGEGEALLNLSRVTPEHFGERVKKHLLDLANRVQEVRTMINEGKLNLLQLGLLRQVLFQGTQPSTGRDWTKGFDRWASNRLVEQQQQDSAAIKAVLNTVEISALLVGTFFGPLGRVVAAGVAVGIEAFQAGQAALEGNRLEKAATVTPLSGTALVSKIQADAKKSEAIAHMVQAITIALLAGGEAIADKLRMIRLKSLVGDDALLAELKLLVKNDEALLLKLLRNPKIADATQLAKLLRSAKVVDVAQAERLIERYQSAEQLNELLTLPEIVTASQLERLALVLRQIGVPTSRLSAKALAGFANTNILSELEAIAPLQASRQITGLDKWVEFNCEKAPNELADALSELREARRLAAENPGSIVRVGREANAPKYPGTNNPMPEHDLSVEASAGEVQKTVEVARIENKVTQATDLTDGVRHAADKVAKRNVAGNPLPGVHEATIEVELQTGRQSLKGGNIREGLEDGTVNLITGDGRVIPKGNILDQFTQSILKVKNNQLLSRVTVVDRSGKAIAVYGRSGTAWTRVR